MVWGMVWGMLLGHGVGAWCGAGTLSEALKQSLNLVPIDDTGLMHMKMRYFKWIDPGAWIIGDI